MIKQELSTQMRVVRDVDFPVIPGVRKFFPSVNCGPIRIAKAKAGLAFVPTTLQDALAISIKFALESVTVPQYKEDIEEMLEELKEDCLPAGASVQTGVPNLDSFFL